MKKGRSVDELCPRGFFIALSSFRWKQLRHFGVVKTLDPKLVLHSVRIALSEDIGAGDVTTLATVPESAMAIAEMRAREPLVVAGLPLAEAAFRELSAQVRIESAVNDGARSAAGDTLMRISGPARALLTAERVALNFVQRLSGVATLTAQHVEAIKGTRTAILDTRKTSPGLRALEKYAVTCGGGRISGSASSTWS